jgi:hypothetical protein
MSTLGSVDEKTSECVDRQLEFMQTMKSLIEIATDNNDLKHQIASHDQRLTAHDSRITVLEVSMADNSSDIKNILKHVENSLSVDDQKKILAYLETYETTKQKAIKWWLVSSSVLLIAVLAGFPLKDIVAGIGKNLLKMIL